MIGQTISHYQILEKLGEGGTGVVYKARDIRLGRLVAVKVLPVEKVTDADRKRRFVQEAKTASALNHLNIITIYDIDQADGVDFIAMEYVAGRTLDNLIPRNGLDLRTALGYTMQVADALTAAHAAGIVHRDLKPANVMVTDSGLVKVLDFGLAKLSEEVVTSIQDDTSKGMTNARPKTGEGAILGTVSYMSPEQAEGRPVDARSDIFSLGSMLYEMVTGQKAFPGETKLATLTAILREEPKSPGEIVKGLPAEVERIISRCLRKDPSRRLQHMADVRVELEELKEESESGKLHALPRLSRRGRRWPLFWVAGLSALLLCAAVVGWFLRPTTRTPALELTAVPLTSYPGIEDFPSFSPDGTQVAFMWNGPHQDNFDVYVKLVGPGPAPLRLTTDPAPDYSPAWSPDGQSIAFLRDLSGGKSAVLLVAPIGGPERQLAEVSSTFSSLPYFLAWSPDGRSLAVVDQEAPTQRPAIFLLSAENNEKHRLTSPPLHSSGDYAPAFSPDGRTLAFVRSKANRASGDIYVLPLSGSLHPEGDPKLLMSQRHPLFGLTWSVDGREIITAPGVSGADSDSLWRVDTDGSGEQERLAFTGDESTSPSLSRQGMRLAYSRGMFNFNIWRLELTGMERKAGPPARFIWSTRRDTSAQFSPDGKKVAFYSSRSGDEEIWVCNGDGSNAIQVTSLHGPSCGTPRWSPDGEQIVFDSNPDGHWDVFVVGANGGRLRRLTNQPTFEAVPSWSRDGKWVYFCSDRTGTYQIWKMPAQGGEAVELTSKGGFTAFESPDGEFVYYTKSEEGAEGLWRMPVAGGEETRVIDSVVAKRAFFVTRDGIYFMTGTKSYTIEFFNFRSRQRKTVVRVENPTLYVDVSPDGRTILYTQIDQPGTDLMLVENFK